MISSLLPGSFASIFPNDLGEVKCNFLEDIITSLDSKNVGLVTANLVSVN